MKHLNEQGIKDSSSCPLCGGKTILIPEKGGIVCMLCGEILFKIKKTGLDDLGNNNLKKPSLFLDESKLDMNYIPELIPIKGGMDYV